MQADLSLGLGVGGDPILNRNSDDLYSANVRLFFPVHRGIRADLSLGAGGGAAFIDPAAGKSFVLGTTGIGTRFRVFMTPTVALAGTIGAVAFIRGERSQYVIAARPLGSASVVYYFR